MTSQANNLSDRSSHEMPLKPRGWMMRLATSLAALMILVGTTACGGGSKSAAPINPGGPGSNNLTAGFTPSNPGGSNTAGLQVAPGSSGGGGALTVQMGLEGTDDVFGASFDISFDPAMVEFVSWSEGTLLENQGTPFYLVSAATPGRVVVGAALPGSSSGYDVNASEPLINLTFRMLQAGSAPLSIENASLDDSQSPPQAIPGINWFGGTLTAN